MLHSYIRVAVCIIRTGRLAAREVDERRHEAAASQRHHEAEAIDGEVLALGDAVHGATQELHALHDPSLSQSANAPNDTHQVTSWPQVLCSMECVHWLKVIWIHLVCRHTTATATRGQLQQGAFLGSAWNEGGGGVEEILANTSKVAVVWV